MSKLAYYGLKLFEKNSDDETRGNTSLKFIDMALSLTSKQNIIQH